MKNQESETETEMNNAPKNSSHEGVSEYFKDINLFRLLLTPSELYILKIFLANLRPLNIREIYELSIKTSFHFCFASKENNTFRTEYKNLWNTLLNAGYGGVTGLNEKDQQKIYDKIESFRDKEPESKHIDRQYKELVAYKIKNPSYDRIKTIVTSFENRGILQSRKESNLTLYTLNPKVYLSIKDKRIEILNL